MKKSSSFVIVVLHEKVLKCYISAGLSYSFCIKIKASTLVLYFYKMKLSIFLNFYKMRLKTFLFLIFCKDTISKIKPSNCGKREIWGGDRSLLMRVYNILLKIYIIYIFGTLLSVTNLCFQSNNRSR